MPFGDSNSDRHSSHLTASTLNPPVDPYSLTASWVSTHFHPLPLVLPLPKILSEFSLSPSSSVHHEDLPTTLHSATRHIHPSSAPITPLDIPEHWPHITELGPPQATIRQTLYTQQVPTLPASSNNKRKPGSTNSPDKASSDCRRKPIQLSREEPPGIFSDSSAPPWVKRILRTLAPGRSMECCVPGTTGVAKLLHDSFEHEYIPPACLTPVSDDEAAISYVRSVISIHEKVVKINSRSQDESTWYPHVRRLLGIRADHPLPRFPDADEDDEGELLQVVDATTKLTRKDIPPAIQVKLDALLLLVPSEPFVARAMEKGLRLNAFTEPSIDEAVVALGVEVKGIGSALEAEYQVAVWGMKTISLVGVLEKLYTENTGKLWPSQERLTSVAMSVVVCAHVWSLLITYCDGDKMVTHGPIVVGGTDSVLSTLRLAKWLCGFKKWYADAGSRDWRELLEGAVEL